MGACCLSWPNSRRGSGDQANVGLDVRHSPKLPQTEKYGSVQILARFFHMKGHVPKFLRHLIQTQGKTQGNPLLLGARASIASGSHCLLFVDSSRIAVISPSRPNPVKQLRSILHRAKAQYAIAFRKRQFVLTKKLVTIFVPLHPPSQPAK